jgi:hypothetical protein
LDNKNASTSNEKVGAVINILDFGVLQDDPETQKARRSIRDGSIFGLHDGKTRSGHVPLLLLCGDFAKKVSIAKQAKMNSEAKSCVLSNDS